MFSLFFSLFRCEFSSETKNAKEAKKKLFGVTVIKRIDYKEEKDYMVSGYFHSIDEFP